MTTTETKRQFCRTTIHDCIPTVTLTFDGGARQLHWCAEHADDAERYRAHSDQRAVSLEPRGCDCWPTFPGRHHPECNTFRERDRSS